MNKEQWMKRIDDFIEELEIDDSIDDEEKENLMGILSDKASDSFNEFGENRDEEEEEDEEGPD